MPLHRMPILAGTLLVGTAMLAAAASLMPATAQEAKGAAAGEVKAVLELFTSQGCSSCPAADALLGQYAERADIIALTLPVDYWDYLGWKDTLAQPKFSARQKHYAKERGDGRVYTPQLVINGASHVIGSSKSNIDEAIAAEARQLATSRVPVKVRIDGKRLVIETGEAPAGLAHKEATIWLLMVDRSVAVKIERGENRGKTVTYANVVRELNPIGMWSGKAGRLEVNREAAAAPGSDSCVVLLQVGKAGPIIGAARAEGL